MFKAGIFRKYPADACFIFARYARKVVLRASGTRLAPTEAERRPAVLARVDICRATDSEQRKLRTVRGIAADRGRNLSLSDRYARQAF